MKLVISSKTAGASSPLLGLETGAKGHLASGEMSDHKPANQGSI